MGEMMMMNMWFWSGYNMGDLLFKGLKVDKQWTFAVTWIVLFLAAFAFEASKVSARFALFLIHFNTLSL